ncbi:MAG: hypothetical protein K1000chlam3_01025 [Chlamydiae bacterium]|nr:hypothetical protein [Chlamydiota bacterium]
MSIYLRTLLPGKPGTLDTLFNGDANRGLEQYACLLRIAQGALTAFKEGNFEEFDALVGENACQIRAVKVAMIASKNLVDPKPLLASIQKRHEELPTSAEKGKSLEALLKDKDIQLSSEAAFLLEAYILTVAKSIDESPSQLRRMEKGSPNQLVTKLGAPSINFATNLTKKVRIFLSQASVKFVQEQADSLGDKQLQRMASQDFEFKFKGCWPSLPMFWTYKTLLFAARQEGIPLIFRVRFQATDDGFRQIRQTYLFLKPGEKSYELCDPSQEDRKKAMIFIDGVAQAKLSDLPTNQQWKENLSSRNLEAIFAGAAAHRQYPDVKEDSRIKALQDEEFLKSQQLAQQAGFSEENPSMFFIQHVYPISLGKAIDKLGAE